MGADYDQKAIGEFGWNGEVCEERFGRRLGSSDTVSELESA